jgi:hypothetical protein
MCVAANQMTSLRFELDMTGKYTYDRI